MKQKYRLYLVLFFVVILIGGILGARVLSVQSKEEQVREYLDLGQEYLDELDYESAIAAYNAVIEIERKCEAAYLGLADIYIAMGNSEKALEVLEKGYSQTESEEMKLRMEEIEASATEDDILPEQNGWEETEYASNGDYVVNEYDYEGKLVKRTVFDSAGSLRDWQEYEYGSDGKLICEVYYNASETEKFRVDTYNEDGNVIKNMFYKSDGTSGTSYEYDYDSKGNCVESRWLLPDGTLYFYHLHEYDENGREVKSTTYEGDGTLFFWMISEYDNQGNMIKEVSYDNEGAGHWYEYEYKNDGKIVVKKTYHGNGTLWDEDVSEYDSNGKLITSQYTNYDNEK